MKIGTDSVLLGSWVTHANPLRILDIGAGTGILALMLAQKFPQASIEAVELDPSSCQQALENFERSPWRDRLRTHCIDFTLFDRSLTHCYDLIVSNPPYFRAPNRHKGHNRQHPGQQRALARFQEHLPFSALIDGVHRLLKPCGLFALILPNPEADEFEAISARYAWHLCRELQVRPSHAKPTHRRLMAWSPIPSSEVQRESLAIRQDEGIYTRDYYELTRDFLLWHKEIPPIELEKQHEKNHYSDQRPTASSFFS